MTAVPRRGRALAGVRRGLRVYRMLFRSALAAAAQYRTNVVLAIAGGLTFQTVGLAFVGAVLAHYGDVAGWGLADIAFLYALRLTAHGLWIVPCGQIGQIDLVVREGEFDRYLVRPADPLLQLLTRRLELTGFGDLVGGLTLLVVASMWADVDWSPAAVAYLVLAVVGGALIELSAQLAAAAGAFRLFSTLGPRTVLDQVFTTLGHYPVTIFGTTVQFAMTYVLPVAFVAYVPASVLLGRTDELAVPGWVAAAAPLVGALLFWAAYRVWARQVRHYASTGH